MHTSAWSPPPGYQPAPSALEGVSVYAPSPKAADTRSDEPTVFKCPKCGANTRFDIAAGGVACEHCGYSAAVQAETVGRQAETFEFTLDTLRQAEQGWGVTRQELHCQACGASLAVAEKALTATCPFCGSNAVNLRTAAADQLRPRFLAPFKTPVENARGSVRAWLGTGWFHPAGLAQAAGLDRLTGVYLPFWTFSADLTGEWEAEVGYEETERYYDSHDKTWKTRTVIHWRWQKGRVTRAVRDLLVSGSTHLSGLILQRLHPFDLGALTAYAPDFLAGWQAHAYDVPLTQAWETGKTRMREIIRAAGEADTGSSHVRNFRLTAVFDAEAWRYILLPVYLTAYRFAGKGYQVMVNGQTGLVAGQKPVEWPKVWLAIAAMLSPGLCLGLIGLPLLAAAGAGLIPLGLGLVALIVGGVFAVKVHRQALDSEAV